jgi:hypothetical protein
VKTRDNTWFLPHFPVLNPNKPGKIRIFFDAAAKSRGFSLNNFLVTGPPDLLTSLYGVLLRFRDLPAKLRKCIIKIILLSMMLLVDVGRSADVYQICAMVFGAASSPFMAQFFNNHNASLHEKTYPGSREQPVRG